MTTITHSTGTIVPTIVHGFAARREARTLIHPVLGSPDDDVSLRPAGRRSGVLELVFSTSAAAVAAEAVFAIGQVLTITDPDVTAVGMSFVVAGGTVGVELSESRRSWIVTVPFKELAP
ncbi:MAG TPA: hypothetical protein VN041_12150 [Microbacterium sp.]|nr:hypothetical protein [Microbacterium sp.]